LDFGTFPKTTLGIPSANDKLLGKSQVVRKRSRVESGIPKKDLGIPKSQKSVGMSAPLAKKQLVQADDGVIGKMRSFDDEQWFFRALFPSFKVMYEAKLKTWRLPPRADKDARKQCPVILVGDDRIDSVVFGGEKRKVSRLLKRVVLHATKPELNNYCTRQHDPAGPDGVREELVEPMEWFAVECGVERLWLSLNVVSNLEEFLVMLFKKEVCTLLQSMRSMVGLIEFKTRLFPDLAYEMVGGRVLKMGSGSVSNTIIFGDPGVGKSTCMRALGTLYWLAGILTLGHMPLEGLGLEKPWRGNELPSQVVGGTAEKVRVSIVDSKGGVFALDEAHNLVTVGYGKEALGTLNGIMTDYLDVLFLIAGYPKEMQELFKVDPGLFSRFSGKNFTLPPYTAEELVEICCRELEKVSLKVTVEVRVTLFECFYDAPSWKSNFGNARAACSVAENIKRLHKRLVGSGSEEQTLIVSERTARDGFEEWCRASDPREESEKLLLPGLLRLKTAYLQKASVRFKENLQSTAREQKQGEVLAVDTFIVEMCRRLNYSGDSAAKFNAKVVEFLNVHSISSLPLLVKTATESLLNEAKLRAVWPFVQELKERGAK
jgi:hypothetical protein